MKVNRLHLTTLYCLPACATYQQNDRSIDWPEVVDGVVVVVAVAFAVVECVQEEVGVNVGWGCCWSFTMYCIMRFVNG